MIEGVAITAPCPVAAAEPITAVRRCFSRLADKPVERVFAELICGDDIAYFRDTDGKPTRLAVPERRETPFLCQHDFTGRHEPHVVALSVVTYRDGPFGFDEGARLAGQAFSMFDRLMREKNVTLGVYFENVQADGVFVHWRRWRPKIVRDSEVFLNLKQD